MAGGDGIERFLGLGFIVDTNVIDDESPASAALRAHASAGRIRLSRTDVVDTELAGAPPEKRAQLLERSAELDEYLGPLVLDHSRLGYAVVGGAADEERLERVFRILHPGGDRQKPGSHDLRDAMHVATAIRYGADGFITLDKGILRKREALVEAFPNFSVFEPLAAVEFVERMLERAQRRSDGR